MNEINSSKRLKFAAAERAEGDKILQVKAAEAEAESKYLSGVGVAKQRKAIGMCVKLVLEFYLVTVQSLRLIQYPFRKKMFHSFRKSKSSPHLQKRRSHIHQFNHCNHGSCQQHCLQPS